MVYQQTIKKKMETKEFFSFGSKLVSANVDVYAIELDTEPDKTGARVCDHNKLIKGKYDGINFPVIFQQQNKGKFNDILDTGWPNLYLISEKLKQLLEDNAITGWKVFPIRLYGLNGNELNGYYGFSIVGHCGPVIYDRSKILEKRLVPHGPLVQYYKGGESFDEWDGSDFFTPEKTYHIFITKRAAQILKKNKISNMSLKNLAEREIDVEMVKMGSGNASTSTPIVEYDIYKACEVDDSFEEYR